MAEKTTPFVVNDRRKFTAEGELRHDLTPEPDRSADEPAGEAAAPGETGSAREPITFPGSTAAEGDRSEDEPRTETPEAGSAREPIAFPGQAATAEQTEEDAQGEPELPPGPTAEQSEQAHRAYGATVDRLDTAVRAMNPGAEPMPALTFDRLIQSLYMQALLQLGGAAEQGQQPQVDILGARQTIDMLGILAEKTRGNLDTNEDRLLQSALFELRMGFLEVTQALARQAAQRQPGPGGPGGMPGGPGGMPGGPSIVR